MLCVLSIHSKQMRTRGKILPHPKYLLAGWEVPLSIDGLLKKQSSGTLDRSLRQGETPAAGTLPAGSSTEQHWAVFGSPWWEHTLEITLKELLYNPYWLLKLQRYFEELSTNQSACSSCSQWDKDMVQKESNRLSDLKSISNYWRIWNLLPF